MSWIRSIFGRRRIYGELSAEIRGHLDEKVAELVATGMPRKDAEAAARRDFGNFTLTEEDARSIWRWVSLENFLLDVRYAVRMLRRNPGFAAVAILTIALGMGANAAIFGLVDAALLNALPFHDSARLMHVWTTDASGETHTPLPAQYLALRKYSTGFEQIAGSGWTDNFLGSDESGWQTVPGLLISSNWLTTLGIHPYLGREFTPAEEVAGQDAVVILSFSSWRSRFRGDPEIIGKNIVLNRRNVTVVGVLPASVGAYYQNVETFAPLVLEGYESNATLRVAGSARLRIVARLRPGVTPDQARSEVAAIAAGLRGPANAADRSGQLLLEDFAAMIRNPGPTMQNERHALLLMAIAAGVVLLIACANVAALLLARGVKRQREVALRAALGCSRGRMIRQLLTESTLLFLLGAGLGLFAAKWSQEIVTRMASGLISSASYVEINARVLGAGLLVGLLSALIFGMIPALQVTRADVNENLKNGVAKVASAAGLRRPRNLLLVFQTALGMILLVGFGLLLRSLLHVKSSAVGFDSRAVLTATVRLPQTLYANPAARAQLMRTAVERVRLLPEVESAGAVDSLPMNGADSNAVKIERPAHETPAEEETWFLSVGPDYFSTLKIPMRAGRTFTASDNQNGHAVAIVNETFAKTYFPRGNPVGYHLAFADAPNTWREIVGVVADFRQRNPEEDLRPLIYLPVQQTLPDRWSLAIRLRASGDLGAASRQIGAVLQTVDAQLYWRMSSIHEQIHDSESLTLRRPVLALLASFGGLALILIVVGVFGVTSYFVSERTREIGVRMALGASRREVLALVLRESLGVALTGLAVGSFGALVLAWFLPTQGIGWSGSGIFLYGVSRNDPFTYLSAVALLIAVVVLASWVPARRAMRVDPMVALRYE